MQKKQLTLAVAAVLASDLGCVYAQDASSSPAGYSGLLTTPSALVMPEGVAELTYGNHIDRRFVNATGSGRNMTALFGIYRGLELGGRLTNYIPHGGGKLPNGFDRLVSRDLSASVKWRLPIEHRWLPDLAVGAADLGGGAPNFKSRYVVASGRPFESLRLSLGWGDGPQRLKGTFGGLEWHATARSVLLADHDALNTFVGLRLYSPQYAWLNHGQIVGTVMRSINAKTDLPGVTKDRVEWQFALQIPLERQYNQAPVPVALRGSPSPVKPPPLQLLARSSPASALDVMSEEPMPAPSPAGLASASDSMPAPLLERVAAQHSSMPLMNNDTEVEVDVLRLIQQRLVQQGFERVRVGQFQNHVVMELENNRYNINQLDAIGIALGIGAKLTASLKSFDGDLIVIQKKFGLASFDYRVNAEQYRHFIEGKGGRGVASNLRVQPGRRISDDEIRWINQGKASSHSWLRVRVNPALTSFYATEVGVVDYSIGVATTASVPLWAGAEWSSTYVERLAESSDFEPNRVFSGSRLRRGFSTHILTQSYWLSPYILNSTSVGQLDYDLRGVQHQSIAFLPGWDHALRFHADISEDKRLNNLPRREAGRFSYRVKLPGMNAWAEIGRLHYTGGDRGELVEVNRFFGDVSVGIRYRQSNTGEKFVGLVTGFPLTFRQELKPGVVHLVGPSRFVHTINTKLVSVGESNTVLFNSAQLPVLVFSQSGLYLNQLRYSQEYAQTQVGRMRDAYLNYAQ